MLHLRFLFVCVYLSSLLVMLVFPNQCQGEIVFMTFLSVKMRNLTLYHLPPAPLFPSFCCYILGLLKSKLLLLINAEIVYFLFKELLFTLKGHAHIDQVYLDLTLFKSFYCLYQLNNSSVPSSLNSYRNTFKNIFK